MANNKMTLLEARRAVEAYAALLVFPIKGKKEPASLWSVFYPRSEMRWEWDEDGDDRVVRLWHLRAELADSKKVAYSKWFRSRATLFDLSLLPALIRVMNPHLGVASDPCLSREAAMLLSVLQESSPRSTKELKEALEWKGRSYEAQFSRASQELFARFLMLGVGEIEDGAFPSLAHAATELAFEKEWEKAKKMSLPAAARKLESALTSNSLFFDQLKRYQKKYLRSAPRKTSKVPKQINWDDL